MWSVGNVTLNQRFWLGTAQYPNPNCMRQAFEQATIEVATVSLGRHLHTRQKNTAFFEQLKQLNCRWLPNTAGCHYAKDAIEMAQLASEIFNTRWIKLEVIGDETSLAPDPFELVKAAKTLVDQGFEVFPFCTNDLVLGKRLLDVGCAGLMPWASPIGSGQGIADPLGLQYLRQRFKEAIIIIDAGIQSPAQACQLMQMGMDGILLNSAVALAQDPVAMAQAFSKAIEAGRAAYLAGLMPKREFAQSSTTLENTPFYAKLWM